jgi:2'-5' RNA ligase
MKFVADLDPVCVPEMLQEVYVISEALPISGRASILDGFPNRHRARVLIVRIESGGILESLVDDKQFQPHVTVGYARRVRQSVPRAAMDVEFELSDVRLVESRDGEYRTISG